MIDDTLVSAVRYEDQTEAHVQHISTYIYRADLMARNAY